MNVKDAKPAKSKTTFSKIVAAAGAIGLGQGRSSSPLNVKKPKGSVLGISGSKMLASSKKGKENSTKTENASENETVQIVHWQERPPIDLTEYEVTPEKIRLFRENLIHERQKRRRLRKRKIRPRTPSPVYSIIKPFKQSDPNAPKPKIVPDIKVKFLTGPTFDEKGRFVRHSILGSLEEFVKVAEDRNELMFYNMDSLYEDRQLTKTKKDIRKTKTAKSSVKRIVSERALSYWEKELSNRKDFMKKLSVKVKRSQSELLMGRSDRCKPVDINSLHVGPDGKSNYWILPERIGNELQGIHLTVPQHIKLLEDLIEFQGVPKFIKNEKGTHDFYKKSEMIGDGILECNNNNGKITIHKPDLWDLEIVCNKERDQFPNRHGNARNITFGSKWMEIVSGFEDIRNAMVSSAFKLKRKKPIVKQTGPSVEVMGKTVRWNGKTTGHEDEIIVSGCVLFEGYVGEMVSSSFKVKNNGTTMIRYWWHKVQRKNVFNSHQALTHRFYFDGGYGDIMPNEEINLPIVFKSPTPGAYNEVWKMTTKPVLHGNAQIHVRFHGVAIQQDFYKDKRKEIEEYLHHQEAKQICKDVMRYIFTRTATPPPPSIPYDLKESPEQIFHRFNPKLFYRKHLVDELEHLWELILTTVNFDKNTNNLSFLSVTDVKKLISYSNAEEKEKNLYCKRLDALVLEMSYAVTHPRTKDSYLFMYQLLQQSIDEMVNTATRLFSFFGLVGQAETHTAPPAQEDSVPSPPSSSTSPDAKLAKKKLKMPDTKADKRRTSVAAKGLQKMGIAERFQKAAVTITSVKRWTSVARGGRRQSIAQRMTATGRMSVAENMEGPLDKFRDHSVRYDKYREKLYLITYQLLCDAVDNMDTLLYGLKKD